MTTTRSRRAQRGRPTVSANSTVKFRLYVAGQTPRSLAAIANLQRICRDHLPGRKSIEVIDLMANPALATRDQIVAIPTLVKLIPKPMRIVIGDLSNVDQVLAGLDLLSEQGLLSLR